MPKNDAAFRLPAKFKLMSHRERIMAKRELYRSMHLQRAAKR